MFDDIFLGYYFPALGLGQFGKIMILKNERQRERSIRRLFFDASISFRSKSNMSLSRRLPITRAHTSPSRRSHMLRVRHDYLPGSAPPFSRRKKKKTTANVHRARIETRPTNKDRKAEKENQAVSRVIVRTSSTNSTRVCLVRKKYVCPQPPSHPTRAAAKGPQNPLTRNFLLRAFLQSFFFRNIRENEKSPSSLAPRRRVRTRRRGA